MLPLGAGHGNAHLLPGYVCHDHVAGMSDMLLMDLPVVEISFCAIVSLDIN
jgi:hypothetical protein